MMRAITYEFIEIQITNLEQKVAASLRVYVYSLDYEMLTRHLSCQSQVKTEYINYLTRIHILAQRNGRTDKENYKVYVCNIH